MMFNLFVNSVSDRVARPSATRAEGVARYAAVFGIKQRREPKDVSEAEGA